MMKNTEATTVNALIPGHVVAGWYTGMPDVVVRRVRVYKDTVVVWWEGRDKPSTFTTGQTVTVR